MAAEVKGQPASLLRLQEHEDQDYEQVVRRLLEQDFEDWPNEAGFEGLTEVQGPRDLEVKGSIPSWAAGTLFRTGPGGYNVDDTPRGTYRTTHWFDGFAHSHKFEIIAGDGDGAVRVKYTSRSQSRGLERKIREKGWRESFSFGQRRDPCLGLFAKMMTIWQNPRPPKVSSWVDEDNVCVTVQADVPGLSANPGSISEPGHRTRPRNLWLTTDASLVKEIDRETLQSIRCATQEDLHPLLTGPLSCAHAQRDPLTGDLFNYNLEFGRRATYRIFRTNVSTGTTDILATIYGASIKPAYIHSFFLSPSYVIFCIPSTHLAALGVKVVWERNILDAIEPFDESKLCKWFIVDRKGDHGVVATFETPAAFFFHSVNSFEEVDKSSGEISVYCDVVEYPTPDVIRSFEVDVLQQNNGMTKNFWGDESRNRNSQARLVRHRFRIPSGAGESRRLPLVSHERLVEIRAPHVGELPTINPRYATKRGRYVYSLPNRGFSPLLDSIAKTDLETRETLYWDNPKGHTPGEAIFVPRRNTNGGEELAEDDGVLLSVILDGHGKTSYLLCLDARTMVELGRAECDWAIGFGFHGVHTPGQDPQR